jgi:hypothetical protein
MRIALFSVTIIQSMAEQTLTRNFAELDLTRIYLKYATLGIGSGGDEEAEDSGYEGDEESPFETPCLTICTSSVDNDNNDNNGEGMVQSFEIMIR